MDRFLAKAIVDLKVPFFGENLKNKHDSASCMFDPRKLLSSPAMLKYIGKKIAKVAKEQCNGNALIGMATSGITWGAVASIYCDLPFLYVRKQLERQTSNKLIEGVIPKDAKLILVDDLLFAGQSKNEALDIIKKHHLQVTDIIVIIDRQLQRKKDGLTIQKKHKLKLHALIKMEEIVDYMVYTKTIEEKQLASLIKDYRTFKRWDMPKFAQ